LRNVAELLEEVEEESGFEGLTGSEERVLVLLSERMQAEDSSSVLSSSSEKR
jgi:hypothetical protein